MNHSFNKSKQKSNNSIPVGHNSVNNIQNGVKSIVIYYFNTPISKIIEYNPAKSSFKDVILSSLDIYFKDFIQ